MSTPEETSKPKAKGWPLDLPSWWWGVTIAMIGLWLFTPTIIEGLYGRGAEPNSGAFGDTFGWLTSIFAVLTTMFVVAGLIIQREELSHLKESLNIQADEFEGQNALTRQQMAFHEIEVRVAAIPTLSMNASMDYNIQYVMRNGTVTEVATPTHHDLTLYNNGNAIFNVEIAIKEDSDFKVLKKRPKLEEGGDFGTKFGFIEGAQSFECRITYLDRFAEPHKKEIVIGIKERGKPVNDFADDAKAIRDEVEKRLIIPKAKTSKA